MQMNGFKPWYDSLTHVQVRKNELQQQFFFATDRMLTATPSDSGVAMTPAQQKEYTTAKSESEKLDVQIKAKTNQMDRITKEHLNFYYDSIARVANRIGKERNLKAVFELGENHPMTCPTDQMLMIDLTNDISLALNFKPHLLRVGVYNSDSLLRLLPGYAVLADSTREELTTLHAVLAVKDSAIAKKQHELDSLRPTLSQRKISTREDEILELQDERDGYRGYELYKIDQRDSARCSSYRKQLRTALSAAAKEKGCLRYYESDVAHVFWTTQEAEFIDLNGLVAIKLEQFGRAQH